MRPNILPVVYKQANKCINTLYRSTWVNESETFTGQVCYSFYVHSNLVLGLYIYMKTLTLSLLYCNTSMQIVGLNPSDKKEPHIPKLLRFRVLKYVCRRLQTQLIFSYIQYFNRSLKKKHVAGMQTCIQWIFKQTTTEWDGFIDFLLNFHFKHQSLEKIDIFMLTS